MSKLERWNPFKFGRKKTEEKKKEAVEKRGTSQAPLAPAEFAALSPFGTLFDRLWRDGLTREPVSLFGDMDRWFGDFSPMRFQPAIDVVDEEDSLRVTAELPGMTKDDITLEMDEGRLTIRGEKRHVAEREENGAYRTERYYGSFERVVPLPADLDREHAKANFDSGVLSVWLPKSTSGEHRTTSIEIK